MTGRKKTTKSSAKANSAKNLAVKKTSMTSKGKPVNSAAKKAVKKTVTAPKKVAPKATASPSKVSPRRKTKAVKKPTKADEEKSRMAEETMKMLARAKKHTPAVFKLPSKKQTPIVFSLEDVREVLKKNQEESSLVEEPVSQTKVIPASPKPKPLTKPPTKPPTKPLTKPLAKPPRKAEKHRVLGAASVVDILGFNPKKHQSPIDREAKNVPKKFLTYYNKLQDLREHVLSGLTLHSQETLKRSLKEDSGNLSSYSQHMADVGSESFERDFALNLLSSEQEALFEIDAAIKRIFDGSYGVCQFTGKPISKERLEAVPFTRYSLEGQAQKESESRRKAPRRGVFMDSSVEAAVEFTKEDAED